MEYPRNNNPADAMQFKKAAENVNDALLHVMLSANHAYGLEVVLSGATAALGQLASDISFHRAKDAKRGPAGAIVKDAAQAAERVAEAIKRIHATIMQFMQDNGVEVTAVDLTKIPQPEAN